MGHARLGAESLGTKLEEEIVRMIIAYFEEHDGLWGSETNLSHLTCMQLKSFLRAAGVLPQELDSASNAEELTVIAMKHDISTRRVQRSYHRLQ